MIYDCFTFYNELDLLFLRFKILNPVVDRFVVVEATRTYSNQPKPLYFADNKDRFKDFADKIIHVVVDDYPAYQDAWSFEKHQRACIMRGLTACRSDDTILISDVDEIPCPKQIIAYKGRPCLWSFRQLMFYYYLNNIDLEQPFWGYTSTKMLSFSSLDAYNQNPQIVRFALGQVITRGGWHFSYLGGADKIVEKIRAFSHQEYNRPPYNDPAWIRQAVIAGRDIFERGRSRRYAGLKLDESFPEYLLSHQEQYQDLLAPTNIRPSDHLRLMVNKIKWGALIALRHSRLNSWRSRQRRSYE